MKIGVMVESFRQGLYGGLEAAAEVGADGVQIYATQKEMNPDVLDRAARRSLRQRIGELGLEVSALCGDFGGHGFAVETDNAARIDGSRRIMDLALELGCNVVTTHIGVIPSDAAHPRYAIMARACEQLARYGESIGATFAIETGPEPASILRRFLDEIGRPEGLAVNFDPANLAMVIAEDIPTAVRTLGMYIVHTHAKDGLNLQPVDPQKLYGVFAGEKATDYRVDDYIREVPLGEGQVPFAAYLAALREVGFDGYLTIEREVGASPRQDIEQAVQFLRGLLQK